MPTFYPDSHGIPSYIYSAANLKNVVEVTPCHTEIEDRSRVSGLLFRYADGRRACVGEIRTDLLGKTLEVKPLKGLHLAFSRADRGPYLAKLSLGAPLEKESFYWLSLPWAGLLEWWFIYGHCKVVHGSQESPSLFN